MQTIVLKEKIRKILCTIKVESKKQGGKGNKQKLYKQAHACV